MATILHVTEALGGGLLTSVSALAEAQAADGHRVVLLHTRRPDTPPGPKLDSEWFSSCRRIEVQRLESRVTMLVRLARSVLVAARQLKPDVIHVHSTLAGVSARAIYPLLRRGSRVFYTPHGFSFVRTDYPVALQRAAFAVEYLAARSCDGMICVSTSEADLARSRLRTPRVHVLENTVDADKLPVWRGHAGRRPVVGTVGRLHRVKAPWRFAELSRALADVADFVWIGDGAAADKAKWFGDAPVEFTGWLPRDAVLDRVAELDVVALLSLQEGMPLALLEAQGIGVPCLGTDVVGIRDVISDRRTGILLKNPDEAPAQLRAMLQDDSGLREMGVAGAAEVRRRFNPDALAQRSLEVYGLVPPTAAPIKSVRRARLKASGSPGEGAVSACSAADEQAAGAPQRNS